MYWILIYFLELIKLNIITFKLLDYRYKKRGSPYVVGFIVVMLSIFITLPTAYIYTFLY